MSQKSKPEATNQYGACAKDLERYAAAFNQSELLTYFGMRIEFPDLETIEAVIDEPHAGHMGGLGEEVAINGGVLAAIYDLVIGCAGAIVDPTTRSATVHLSMNFERPVIGPYLRAQAKVDRAGRKLVFVSAKIFDQEGQICSHGQGIVRRSSMAWQGDSPAG